MSAKKKPKKKKYIFNAEPELQTMIEKYHSETAESENIGQAIRQLIRRGYNHFVSERLEDVKSLATPRI